MDKYQKTVDTFNAVAEQYWQKFKDFKLYQPSYDWFYESLPTGSIDMLEVACGPGNVSQYLLNKNPAMNILGIDLAAKMVALAKLHNPEANYAVLDCRNIMTINRSFDAIMCGFCLPYISWQDSQTLIQNMATMLQPGGLLYLSTTAGDKKDEGFKGSSSAAGATYVHYHTIDDIIDSLEDCGLKVLGRKNMTHIHNEQTTKDVFILARKPV